MDTGNAGKVTEIGAKKVQLVLPTTKAGLIAARNVLSTESIHDHVEPIFVALWEDDTFRSYFDGVFDSDCQEGSIRADEHMAAVAIRAHAAKTGDTYLVKKNIATITKSLHVVMNRYNLNRSLRRQMVGGEKVASASSEE